MRLRKLIPCKSKLILYKTSILPHLTYCHLAWHFCKASDRRIQERAFRAIYQSSTTPYQQLLDQAKLPTLYNTRLQERIGTRQHNRNIGYKEQEIQSYE